MIGNKEFSFLFVVAASYVVMGMIDFGNFIFGAANRSALAYFSFSKNAYYEYLFYYLIFCLMFFASAFSFSISSVAAKKREPLKIKSRSAKDSYALAESAYLIFFIAILISIFFEALSVGLLEYGVQVRIGVQELGGAFYVASIGGVMIAVKGSERRGFGGGLRALFIVLFVFINLLSGFRWMIIWALVFFIIHRWWDTGFKFTAGTSFGLVFVLLSFFIYEYVRSGLEAGASFDGAIHPLGSLNRSAPITTMIAVDYYRLIIDAPYLSYLFDPIAAFFTFLGFDVQTTGFERVYLTEPLYRGFLIWRGTPASEATGLSLHAATIFWAHGRLIGLMIGAMILAVVFRLGHSLTVRAGVWGSWLGNVCFTSLLFVNESLAVTVGLAVYAVGFVVVFAVSVTLIRWLLGRAHVSAQD